MNEGMAIGSLLGGSLTFPLLFSEREKDVKEIARCVFEWAR